MPRQKLGLPVEPKGFGQNVGMKMKKFVHPASRKPERAAWAKMGIPVDWKPERAVQAKDRDQSVRLCPGISKICQSPTQVSSSLTSETGAIMSYPGDPIALSTKVQRKDQHKDDYHLPLQIPDRGLTSETKQDNHPLNQNHTTLHRFLLNFQKKFYTNLSHK